MRTLSLAAVLSATILFAACGGPATQPDMHGMQMQETARPLTVSDSSSGSTVRFSVMDGAEALTHFAVVHEKPMHLIVVRDDLRHFAHIHPDMDGSGTWTVPYTPEAGGTYWLYADFAEADGTPHVIRFTRVYPGDAGNSGLEVDGATAKKTDGYAVTMRAMTGGMLSFDFSVTAPGGKPAVLEPYLGAMGHLVMISPSGDFIHTHPDQGSPVFAIHDKPKEGFYRLYFQFQAGGSVHMASFDWNAR